MPHFATAEPTFTCTYDTAHQRLHGCWHGPVTDADLYEHYAELMSLAEAHDCCRFWQLDMVARNWHQSDFGRWFGNEFAPLAHAALGGPLFIAYVVSPAHYAAANKPSTQATQHNCAAFDVYPFFFDQVDCAQEWLAHQQAHDEKTRSRPVA
jgi:hypothetical protein